MNRLCWLITLLLILVPSLSTAATLSLQDEIIVLDAGHGGPYDGAIANSVREADLNLAITKRLGRILSEHGAQIVFTRLDNVSLTPPHLSLASDLQARIDLVKKHNADIFVSIHANADSDSNMSGFICFYGTNRPNELAAYIHQSVLKRLPISDGGIRAANFYVLVNNSAPAVLVETGFLTNAAEAALLIQSDYQEILASGIAQGIMEYLQNREIRPKLPHFAN